MTLAALLTFMHKTILVVGQKVKNPEQGDRKSQVDNENRKEQVLKKRRGQ